MQLEVARRAFIRIRDVRYVELVNRTEAGRKAGVAEGLLMAEIYGGIVVNEELGCLYHEVQHHNSCCAALRSILARHA
jgi:hypothetical protein